MVYLFLVFTLLMEVGTSYAGRIVFLSLLSYVTVLVYIWYHWSRLILKELQILAVRLLPGFFLAVLTVIVLAVVGILSGLILVSFVFKSNFNSNIQFYVYPLISYLTLGVMIMAFLVLFLLILLNILVLERASSTKHLILLEARNLKLTLLIVAMLPILSILLGTLWVMFMPHFILIKYFLSHYNEFFGGPFSKKLHKFLSGSEIYAMGLVTHLPKESLDVDGSENSAGGGFKKPFLPATHPSVKKTSTFLEGAEIVIDDPKKRAPFTIDPYHIMSPMNPDDIPKYMARVRRGLPYTPLSTVNDYRQFLLERAEQAKKLEELKELQKKGK